MKIKALRELGAVELQTKAQELVDEIFHLRLRRSTAQLANPMKLTHARRDLARIKTLLREQAQKA
jgi:large subunit ribosomal protein L29